MASTIIIYEGDGTRTDFTVPFDYLKKSFVTVRLGPGTTLTGGDYGDTGSDYYFLDKTTIRLKVAPASGESLTIRRYTSATERVVTFKDASILKATDLDTSQVQAFHIAEEGRDILEDSLSVNREGNWDAKNKRVVNLADPVNPQDALTKAYYDADSQKVQANRDETEKFMGRAETAADSAKASEVSASKSEANAKASADTAVSASIKTETLHADTQVLHDNAKVSADNAKVSAAASKKSEDNAKVSAAASKKSEDNAKVSEANAKASEDKAKQSEANAKASEEAAKESEDYVKETADVVVPIAPEIKIVANNITHVQTTSNNIKDVNLVGSDLDGSLDISTFLDYGDLGDTSGTIPTITGGNIKVVADNIEDVRTVAGLTDDFQTVINSVETVTSLTTRAETAATTATTKATEASNSATAAATSATNAKDSETAANASETAANASETNAASSATKAASSAASASTSATNASNSATAAATSATNAGISATNAGASADSAEASATEATTQAERAKEYAEQASTGQVQADWSEADNTAKSFIKNKPSVNTYNVVLAELQEGTKTTFGYVTAAGIRGAIKKWAPTDVDISGKADITYVDEQVATKLDVTAFNSYVDYGDLGDL